MPDSDWLSVFLDYNKGPILSEYTKNQGLNVIQGLNCAHIFRCLSGYHRWLT
jgi:hypothetical protein